MKVSTQELNRSQLWQRKSLIVEFTCPAHLKDSQIFCREQGLENELMLALTGVIRMFISDAAGYHGFQGGDDGPEPPIKGEVTRVVFSPDTPSRPSFTWRAERLLDKPGAKPVNLLHGGLIYRENEGWSIHT